MSKKLKKSEINANRDFIKTWEDYQADRLESENHALPLLLPVFVGIDEAAEIVRNRIKANLLGDPSDADSLIAKAIESSPRYMSEHLKKVHADYVDFFGKQDKAQSGFPPSPLDFHIKMPVMFMFVLSNKNWSFTGGKQFSTDNDSDANPTVKQICTFGRMEGILVETNNKAKERIKYNLHVTIAQHAMDSRSQEMKLMTTDIIIDPGMDNDDNSTGG